MTRSATTALRKGSKMKTPAERRSSAKSRRPSAPRESRPVDYLDLIVFVFLSALMLFVAAPMMAVAGTALALSDGAVLFIALLSVVVVPHAFARPIARVLRGEDE